MSANKGEQGSSSAAASGAAPAPFDPLAGVFVAQSGRPPHLQDVDLGDLSPFQRACLTIDGTVTRFLEAQKMEPIEIIDCGQTRETLKKDHAWLDLPKGQEVVSRRVLLRGEHSGTVYASAASLVVPDRVKQAVGHQRTKIKEGLGRMLLNGRIEQYRELLWYGKEPCSDLPGEMRGVSSADSLMRTYRIIVGNRPIMMISEWFEFDTEDDR